MPNVYNVSEITNILSGIIQDQSLQDVWIYGKILEILPPNRLTLGDTGCSIDCRNDGKDAALFVGLGPKKVYYAYGKVIVNPQKSKYRFAVTKIQPNPPPNLFVDTSSLTEKLKQTIKQLEIVQVQGKISSIDQKGGFTLLHLKDANSNKWTDREMIECAIRPGINPKIALNLDDDVCVRGQIDIFQKASQYQIIIANADDMMPGFSLEQCRCPGCKSCQRSRDNIQCAQPLNSQHELCSPCYAISPHNEKRVEEAVETYFFALNVKEFSPKTQHRIQIGSEERRPDVVLADENGSFAAIAECKGAGYIGHGIEQLKSYLSATDTRFGIFANRACRGQWKFYENRRRNQFDQIDRCKFEAGVVEGIATRERLRDEIRDLNGEITGLENQKSELRAAVEQITQTEHNLNERTSYLTQQVEALENYKPELHEEIHRKLDNLLEEKMQRLEKPLSDLKSELQRQGIVSKLKNLFSKEKK